MTSSKIISPETAPQLLKALRAQGKRVVHCHGVFDLIHSGHVHHLEQARGLGDVLVVTVTGDDFAGKGTNKPHFDEVLRARMVAALGFVDYVLIGPFASAAEAIEWVRPQVYCKGKEFEGKDPSCRGGMEEELRAVAKVGGEISYVGSTSVSTAKLLNESVEELDGPVVEFCRALAREVSPSDFQQAVEQFSSLRVLIVGDTIFDRYSYVKVQGLTSKNRIISGRFLSEETQCGGALAVFRHVKQFTDQVKFISLVGAETWVEPILQAHLTPEQDRIVREPSFTTIVKQRFVEPLSKGKELSKLFSVNHIDAYPPAKAVQEGIYARIATEIEGVDLVLALDFGHGLLQPLLRQLVQDKAPFLALNCQTNSNNHGFNIISRQYQRADAFSLDEQELSLAAGHRHIDFGVELELLRKQLRARYAWLTRGPVETLGHQEGKMPSKCPPFENDVVDTIGAGDAFFSVAALAAAHHWPVASATFLGQLAGAQAVKIVGNSVPISKATLVQRGISLLSR